MYHHLCSSRHNSSGMTVRSPGLGNWSESHQNKRKTFKDSEKHNIKYGSSLLVVSSQTTVVSRSAVRIRSGGSQLGVILPPKRHLTISVDIVGCHSLGWGGAVSCIQWAEARDAARSYTAQHGPLKQRIIQPECHCAAVETPRFTVNHQETVKQTLNKCNS